MNFQLRKAERKKAKIKMALQSPSGAGKTYSALLLAFGITGDWSKIALIDTENGSADLYAHLGSYNVLRLETPFSPERYINAIDVCANAEIEVIIIDSLSHCWEYLLDYHANLQGNSFTNWAKVTPRQKEFINKILQTDCHFICTTRVKQDYVLNLKNGKHVPEKVGLKSIQRDGVDYEFTIVLDIDLSHHAKCSKDRTGLFMGKPEFVITKETGEKIKQWCETGTSIEEVKIQINNCTDLEQLNDVYRQYKDLYGHLEADFKRKKATLNNHSQTFKTSNNGVVTN